MNLRQAKKLVNGRCFKKKGHEETHTYGSVSVTWRGCNMFRFKEALRVYNHHLKKGKKK